MEDVETFVTNDKLFTQTVCASGLSTLHCVKICLRELCVHIFVHGGIREHERTNCGKKLEESEKERAREWGVEHIKIN